MTDDASGLSMSDRFRKTLQMLYQIGVDRQHVRAEYLIDKLVTDMQALELVAGENVIKAVANANHAAVKESAELRDALMRIATYHADTGIPDEIHVMNIARKALGMEAK